jgi:hypothetical protein
LTKHANGPEEISLRRSLLIILGIAMVAMVAGFFFFSTGNMGQ